MQPLLATVLTCLWASSLAKPIVVIPIIAAPLNWPASPSKVVSSLGGMRPTSRIAAEGRSNQLESIMDAQTRLYAMLIVVVEPKEEYVPIGHNDFFPNVPPMVHSEGDDQQLNNHYPYNMPAESYIAGNEDGESEDVSALDSGDMEAVPYDIVAPEMIH